jgi:hypothetical protein
MQVEIKQKL